MPAPVVIRRRSVVEAAQYALDHLDEAMTKHGGTHGALLLSAHVDALIQEVNRLQGDVDQLLVAGAVAGVGTDPHGYYADTPGSRARQLIAAEKDRDELQAFFDLMWAKMQRAITLWQAEKPEERELTWPDAGRLLDWLIGRGSGAAMKVVEAAEVWHDAGPHDRLDASEDLACAVDGWRATRA